VLKELRAAEFSAVRRRGSHTMWEHPSGARVAVPYGHTVISPGVYRAVLAAIERSRASSRVDEEE
jgi:predicted RNA binding protein YcfA (HicA-like mRNA interferase family)